MPGDALFALHAGYVRLPNIFNGAVGNATGVAALLRSARSADNPIFPLAQTVAVMNMNSIPFGGPKRDVSVVGYGASELETYLVAAANMAYFESGSGRVWNCTTSGLLPLPPSISHGVRSPLVTHNPRPFQPAFGSSTRPSIPFI